jgi:hypothetical protein
MAGSTLIVNISLIYAPSDLAVRVGAAKPPGFLPDAGDEQQ